MLCSELLLPEKPEVNAVLELLLVVVEWCLRSIFCPTCDIHHVRGRLPCRDLCNSKVSDSYYL